MLNLLYGLSLQVRPLSKFDSRLEEGGHCPQGKQNVSIQLTDSIFSPEDIFNKTFRLL